MAKELTTESYIDHHLTNLTCGHVGMDESAGIYKSFWTCDPYMVEKMGFWAFHVDSLFWSVFLGGIFLFLFKRVMSKNKGSYVAPNCLQNFGEM
jgi:F-type H+-transporting ATPase subunit a